MQLTQNKQREASLIADSFTFFQKDCAISDTRSRAAASAAQAASSDFETTERPQSFKMRNSALQEQQQIPCLPTAAGRRQAGSSDASRILARLGGQARNDNIKCERYIARHGEQALAGRRGRGPFLRPFLRQGKQGEQAKWSFAKGEFFAVAL